MSFKFGDILINHYAGETNPCRRLVFIRRSGRYYKLICPYDNEEWDMEVRGHRLQKVGSILKFPLKEVRERMIKVKLNEKGWKIYKELNGFSESNIDDDGYSTFSYGYLEELFFPMPYKEFSHDVITIKEGDKNGQS